MHSRLALLLAFVTTTGISAPLAAQSPAPDPVARLGRTIDAFLAVDSFHIRIDAVSEADHAMAAFMGTGTQALEGDISLADGQARVEFETLIFGGAGEMLRASDGHLYTRLAVDPTGLWHRSPSGEMAWPLPFDPATIDDDAKEILGRPGVSATFVEEVPCPAAATRGTGAQCDVIDLVLPASAIGFDGDLTPWVSPTPSRPPVPDVQLRVHVDQATGLPDTLTWDLVLPGVSTSMGSITITDYGLAVDVEPPPASAVTDDPFPIEIFLGASPVP